VVLYPVELRPDAVRSERADPRTRVRTFAVGRVIALLPARRAPACATLSSSNATGFIKLQRKTRWSQFPAASKRRYAAMGKAPPWHTPAWLLLHELRPIYAAVNRVHELEATSGVSPAQTHRRRSFNFGYFLRCWTREIAVSANATTTSAIAMMLGTAQVLLRPADSAGVSR